MALARARSLASLCMIALAALAGGATSAFALERCLAVARGPVIEPDRPKVMKASLRLAQLKPAEARITFVGHSTFLIESADGVRIATDYNDYVKPSVVPEIATMNRAHDSHYTNFPEPQIVHVLRGWGPNGDAAAHDVTLKDVRVRNIPTHIRGWDGSPGQFGNSIFVFEVGELCIAHLGHLHHTLKPEQLAQLGQMDIVLVPVDGSYTLDLDGMIEVLKSIRAPLMIPMHYFSRWTLDRFLTRVKDEFAVQESTDPMIVVSRATLPKKQEVWVLPGR